MSADELPPRTLADWFLRGHDLDPSATAVRAGGRELTYAELLDGARRTATGIRAATGVPRPRVGVLAARGADACTGLLAAALCGGTIVPLGVDLPEPRLRDMAGAAGVDVLVTDGTGARVREGSPALRALPVATTGEAPLDLDPAHWSDPAAIAYVLFTSGSTGTPKGVPVRNAQVDHYLRVVHRRYGFTSADVFSQNFDLTFDLALFDLFAAWGSGGTLVTVPSTAMAALPRYLERHGVTVWFSAPSAVALARRWGQLAPGALPTLRWSLFCGEPLLATDAHDWQAAAPGSVVENLYGPTELTISCTAHRWDDRTSPARSVNGVVPIGTVHEGLRVLLLDPAGEVSAEAGELCVSGPQTIAGYLDARDDDGRFLERDGVRWYRTGDLVRWSEHGELLYLGRGDGQVQVRGVRIELAEVDHAVASCDGVQQAVTVQADGELVSFFTGAVRDPAELRRELATVLPRTSLPRELRHLDALPLNANRKVDRPRLQRLAAVPVPAARVRTELPGPQSRRLLQQQALRESSARNYPRNLPLALAGGTGSYVHDLDGNVFLDLLTGAGVLALGHGHPDLVAAAHAQLDLETHALDFPTDAKDQFTELLFERLPEQVRDRYRVHFCGPTGADAVDAAVKLCKTHTGRGDVVAFRGGFHGSTQSTLALSGIVEHKEPLQNLMPGVSFFPYSPCPACQVDHSPEDCANDCARYLEAALTDAGGGMRRPAAVVLELVQGEGGVVPAHPEFVRRVRELTRRLDVPLVVDEVQTGGGRTGTFFAFEQYDVEPDVVVLSKALGGGHPLAVILYHERLDGWRPGAHTGTFRGNQLAFAAGAEFLRVLRRDGLLEHVRDVGSRLRAGLVDLAAAHPFLGEVRGAGLMLGIQVVDHEGRAASATAAAVQQAALRRGLLFELGGRDDTVLRFLPPVNLSSSEAVETLGLLRAACDDVARPDVSDPDGWVRLP